MYVAFAILLLAHGFAHLVGFVGPWGLATGITPQTTLLVKRDGRLIGRVRPSAIEPTQTIADIDLESLAAGVRLQPGDRVILATPESR